MNNNNITFARVETNLIMDPFYSNVFGNAHGGELVKIMDNIAGMTSFKHAKGAVVTARIDEIVYHKPVPIGNIITCTGQLAYVGTSSLLVMVNIVTQSITNSEPELAVTGVFTMVHLKDKKPSKAPTLTIITKEDEELYKLGEEKYNEIKSKLG